MSDVSTEVTTNVKRFSVAFRYVNLWDKTYDVHEIVEATSAEEALGKTLQRYMKTTSGDTKVTGRKFLFGGEFDHVVFEI